MLHNVLIAAHATCAVAAFGLGLVAVWKPGSSVSILFRSYLGALWLMVLFLVIVILLDWAEAGDSPAIPVNQA